MPAVQDHGDVDVKDVAVLQFPLARNAMAHDMIDRGADRLRIAAVVERRRHGVVRDDELVAQRVERAGGDARPHMLGDHVQRFGGQTAGGTHPDEILPGVNGYASCVGPTVHLWLAPGFPRHHHGRAETCATEARRARPISVRTGRHRGSRMAEFGLAI